MKKEMFEKYKTVLKKLRAKLIDDIDHIEKEHMHKSNVLDSGDSYYPIHAADIANEVFETETSFMIKSSEEDLLKYIDNALERMDEGIYGICVDCGDRINKKRLKALPWATRCIDCKNKYEKEAKTY